MKILLGLLCFLRYFKSADLNDVSTDGSCEIGPNYGKAIKIIKDSDQDKNTEFSCIDGLGKFLRKQRDELYFKTNETKTIATPYLNILDRVKADKL